MIYLLTAVGLTHGGSSTVKIYTQTIQWKENIRVQNRTYIWSRLVSSDTPAQWTARKFFWSRDFICQHLFIVLV